jgi:hypothetical protein
MKSILLLTYVLGYKQLYRRDVEGQRLEGLCNHDTHTVNKFQWRVCDGDNYLSCGNAPWPRVIKIECGEGKTCKDTTEEPGRDNVACIWKSDA